MEYICRLSAITQEYTISANCVFLLFFVMCIHMNMCIICYGIDYSDVIMSAAASQITGLSIVYLIVCLGADQRKHQSSAPLAFVRGIHRGPGTSPHKRPVRRKCFHLMTSSWNSHISRNVNTETIPGDYDVYIFHTFRILRQRYFTRNGYGISNRLINHPIWLFLKSV